MSKIDKKKPVLFREMGEFTEENGEITRISVSSERPCRDYIWHPELERVVAADVTLVHSQEAIDWDWIEGGIPLRNLHYGEVVARAMSPFIEGGKLVSTDVKWGDGYSAERIHKDAAAGVSPAMSIEADYNLEDCVFSIREDGVYDVRVNRWRPLAAAFVPVPADPSVGVNRSYEGTIGQGETQSVNITSTNGEVPAVNVEKFKVVPDGAATASREAVTAPAIEVKMEENKVDAVGILDVCGKHGVSVDTARGYIEKGMTVDAVRAAILDGYADKAKAVPEVKTGVVAQMEKAENRHYSFGRAIRAQLPNSREDAGFEIECSQELARQFGRQPEGIFLARDVTTTTGAGLVPTTQRPQDYIDILRNKLVFPALGVRVLTGLMGEITIPKATADATAAAVAEAAATPKSEPTFDQLTLKPHAISSHVVMTKQMANNSDPAAEGLILDMMLAAVAEKIQSQVLFGQGSGAEIKGLATDLEDLGAVTDWAGIVGMQGAVVGANVDLARCQWLINPLTFSDLRAIARNAAGGDLFAASIDGTAMRIADVIAQATSTVPEKTAIFGDWNNLILGLFGPLDVVVDPYTKSDEHKIRLTATQYADAVNAGGGRFAYTTQMTGAGA